MSFLDDLLNAVKGGIEGGLRQALDEVSSPKENASDIKPGDVNIKSLALRSADGNKAWSLLSYVSSFSVYESIMSPVIYCDMDVLDTIQLEQSFPIVGGEIVDIEFETPSMQSISYRFFINGGPINKQVLTNNRGVTYRLRLASVDVLTNLFVTSKDGKGHFVSKKVKGTASDLIKGILQDDMKLELPCKISPTKGIIEEDIVYGLPDVAGNYMTPFRYVDKIRINAKSSDDKSSAFHFFLNKDGYHFISLEKMLQDGQKNHGHGSDKVFFFDNRRNTNLDDVKFRNILAYNHVQRGTTTDYQQIGGFNSEAFAFDVLSFDLKRYNVTDAEGAGAFTNSDKQGLYVNKQLLDKAKKTVTHSSFFATRTDLANPGIEEKTPYLRSFIAKITQNTLQIEVYGDTELTVGDTVEVFLPPATTADKSAGEMNLVSGLYLISLLRHMVINSDRPQHIISMELIKNGILEA